MEDELAESEAKFQLRGFAKSGWRRLINVLTPARCLSCRVFVQEGASLCVECWQKLVVIEYPVCDVLGTPFAYDQGSGALSAAAIADPPPWDKGRGAVGFSDVAKNVVHGLKYRDNAECGLLMLRMMARAGRDLLAEADVVLPVPLHPRRLWKRRFNQAASLAKPLAAAAGKLYFTDVLLRPVATPQQVGLSAEARRKNVRKAFAIPAKKANLIVGKTVLLIDDVRTTGATLGACAEALKKAGAARVLVLTFALVLDAHRFHIEA